MPRIIYSLELDLYAPARDGSSLQLIAPLDAAGQSPHVRPNDSHKRVVDLRPNDWIRHARRPFRIRAIRAYRENYVDGDYAPSDRDPLPGYVVAESAGAAC